jgi:hypothetical protein
MNARRLRRPLVLAAVALVALAAVSGAAALLTPGRTLRADGPVRLVALNHASFAYAVGRSQRDCDHVELWNTDTRGHWRFGRPGACTNLGSTGAGISALGVSGNRALWVRYNGGNERDWQLMTATTTQKLPKQLRFVPQDVELPSPFVIGDSTGGLGIPYADRKEVVLLGANGAAVFKHVDPSRITAVTAGLGPGKAVVAALRETGEVVLLKSDGTVAWTASYPAGAVKAIALAPTGLLVQLAGSVERRTATGVTGTTTLPAGAKVIDFAEGHIVYTVGNQIRSRQPATGKDALLLIGAAATVPTVATVDTHGFAWGRGPTVNFECAGCVGTAW